MPYLPEASALKGPLEILYSKAVSGLPRVAAEIAGKLPEPLHLKAAEHVLNRSLRQPLEAGEFDFLRGRTVNIQTLDAEWSISITVLDDRRFRVRHGSGAETRISATARDFMEMASGRTDPDTLFFQRRLRIEGDVALGLETKNTLDGVDRGMLPLPLQTLLKIARAWIARGGSAMTGADHARPRLSSPARPYQ